MSKIQVTLLVVAIAVGAIFGLNYYKELSNQDKKAIAPKRAKGSPNAKLQITEYIDFQCPSCAYGSKYLSEIIEKHPDLIRLELKYYPLNMHKHAFVASKYAECSLKQDKFWEFHDKVLAQQSYWKKLVNAMPAFDSLARDVGVEEASFRECLADEKTEVIINKHKADGKALGVRSTPTYFINGEVVVGAKALQDFVTKHLPAVEE